jgi:NAD(P)-dependent dehydrogenase (short-subunit alcohol dehydrogenase family)
MGGIDGVVNAAGIVLRGSVGDTGVASWRRVLEVNLTGTYIVVRCALPWLARAPFATIVNIASGQGLLPTPNLTAYAASKGGVVNLTRALAAELAPAIRVNSVCPGMVDTPMTAGFPCEADRYALNRIADPLEIAQAILFLPPRNHPLLPVRRWRSTADAPSIERVHGNLLWRARRIFRCARAVSVRAAEPGRNGH